MADQRQKNLRRLYGHCRAIYFQSKISERLLTRPLGGLGKEIGNFEIFTTYAITSRIFSFRGTIERQSMHGTLSA